VALSGGVVPCRCAACATLGTRRRVAHRLTSACTPPACRTARAGSLQVNDQVLGTRDAARIKGADDAQTLLKVSAQEQGAHWMLIEMAKSDD
jgi:hypothetical protein